MRLFALPLICSLVVGFSHGLNVCRNTCNDGGCDYTNREGTYKGCDCRFSKGIRTGNQCESFTKPCEINDPCKNGGKCVSMLGYPYCDCPTSYHGDFCEEYHDSSDVLFPKKPSIYYRMKTRPGEQIFTNLVMVVDDKTPFLFHIKNVAIGSSMAMHSGFAKFMTADQFYSSCIMDLGTKDFSVNKDMCNFAKTTYGDSNILVFHSIPYFIPKTRFKRTDVYFNGDRSEGRMGGKYTVVVQLFRSDVPGGLLSYDLYHLVVDDELTYCLPFVDPGENCKNSVDLLKVKRSEDVPVIKMLITPDTEVCNKSITYTYQWKIFDGMTSTFFNFKPFDPNKMKGLEHTIMNSQDIAISQYVLPKGNFLLLFELFIDDDNYKQYNKNQFMCFLDVDIDGLHAEIVGKSVRPVSDSDLVTLDASLSRNPNEPRNKQGEILYIWHCDVPADKENCQKYITSNPVRNLIAPLNKSEKYVFELVTMVNDEYARRVGNPKHGTAKVTLLPKSSVFNIVIKCIKNCGRLSSPLEIIYLLIETECKNCSFEWYYKERSDSVFTSVKNIRELNTPPHVFIAKRHSLDYDKTFTFKVKDSSMELENSIVIRTAAKPKAGECHVNPTTGIAGMTLFTITCSQFHDVYGDNALFYYYYEQYGIDENGLGLLIDRGSNKLNNIKLSTSGKLKVLVFNSFGAYATVETSVQISKNRTGKLSRILRSMKNKLFSGQMSAMVQMLSIACNTLLESKKTKGFSVIFNTLSKVPPKGSLFLIEQTLLALKKVVLTYCAVNDNKIKPPDALEISTNLLLSASNIFEYLKTHLSKDITKDVEKIERIFDIMKTIIDIVFKDFDPIIYTKDSGDSLRYFWSSFENTALVVQNVEETLMVFGESIVLHKVIYEKHKIYESKESSLWTDLISADVLKEQNIIGHDLADELLSKKNASWGFKVFEIGEKSGLWTEPKSRSDSVKSVIKYVALSAHDPRNREYLGLVDEFVSPASITFNVTETVDGNDEQYTIRVPAAGSERIQFDKAVLVFRMDMTEIGAIFVTIKSRSHVLHVAWTRDCRPDSELMADEQNVIKIPVGVDGYNVTFKTQSRHQNDVHYIGIFTDTEANNSSSDRAYDVKFNMEMVCMRCAYWDNGVWSSRGLEIGSNSSVGGRVYCLTDHFSLFSSSIFAPPKLLNPIDEIQLFSTIADNMVCLILLAIVFTIYFILLYWSSIQDEKDIFMGRIIILDDNYTGEDEAYLITVYTGHGIGSGTTANVCVELNGTIRNSRAHWLHSPYYRTLLRSNDDWFLVFTPQSLGDLQSIHIWHDNFGTDPDWYCQRIIVSEIRTNKIWAFEVDRWFSLRRPAENIEHTIHSTALNRDWRIDTQEHIGMGIREKHLWASVFIRHPRSPITRCQRLSVILSAVLSIMLASMIFYDVKHTDEEMFGKFELKLREFIVAIQSVMVEMLLTYGVQSCFERGRKVQLNKIEQVQTLRRKTEEITANQSMAKKMLEFIVGRLAKKNVYYPVDTETIMERRQWNYWFILGWICCITVYIITVFYIILYGLKFGRVKSLCWLASIAIGILQGAIVSTPFKIVLISLALAKYSLSGKNELMTYAYQLTLHRYRTKTLLLLQDVDYVRMIRKYRRSRYFYMPSTSGVVDIFRKRRKLMADRKRLIAEVVFCAIFISTSLCCLYHLNVLGNQNHTHLTNRITYRYLEECVFGGSNNRRISLDGLRNLLSRKFLKALYSAELYNGMPISNESIDTIQYGNIGWFGLYNARLIGGGVRLRQQRIDSTGKLDTRIYGPGWTEPVANNGTAVATPWTYSCNEKFSFFGNGSRPLLDDAEGYYQLHLSGGGLVENKIKLDENLKLKWLDTNTRRFSIEFQMYTPDADSITAVEIRITTDCGLSYTISTNAVQTLPASSVIVDWDAYVFAAVAAVALVAFAAARLLACAGHGRVRWTSASAVAAAFDGLLAALAVATASALFQRQAAMERATAAVAAAGHDELTAARRAQTACASCAAFTAAAALLRLSRSLWPDSDDSPWTAVAIVVAAATTVAGSGAPFAAGIIAAVLLLFVGSRRASEAKRKSRQTTHTTSAAAITL